MDITPQIQAIKGDCSMNKSRLSMTLMLYLMRHTGLRILAATGAVVMLVAIIDTSELFRRVSNATPIMTNEATSQPLVSGERRVIDKNPAPPISRESR